MLNALPVSYIPNLQGFWLDSELVCALADDYRHLGHLIRRKEWHAYDATQAGEKPEDFRFLGAFADLASAKQAVELAVWRCPAGGSVH